MYKIGELTDVGRFIRQTLDGNPELKNREVADMVINHFPDQAFGMISLRQRIANYRYLKNKATRKFYQEHGYC